MKTKKVEDCYSPEKKKRARTARKPNKHKVLKMLAVMENQQAASSSGSTGAPVVTPENGAHAKEFLSSGRTGRRNALPNILGEHAIVTSSDLPNRLQALTTSEKLEDTKDVPGPSSKS